MDDRAGTGDGEPDIPDRLNMKVAGPAIAAGAVSLGLVLIGACGIGHKDVYVAPPPLAADLQVASTPIKRSGTTTTPQVQIPPSPSWRVAANTPARRTTTSSTATSTTTTAPGYTPYAPYTPPTTTESTTTTTETYDDDPYDRDPYGDTTTTPRHTTHSADESDPGLPTTEADEGN
ncbi:hypothetical protein NONO_c63620 [Nocardia nova SH22a]|uniref:Lipoprotein n=1 Tax=Nocardia nova SH22a TaxID=1415166 RepID=W5TPF1_9NOCA|nr:hypothetical protein [Nocardia nova]AHH21132.1 hypothetical protein NONO_c63620 [Nocardia nova SH22a]